CLFRNRFNAVFTEFVERSFVVWIRPRAPRTVGSIKLVQVRERRDASGEPRLFDRKLRRFENGVQSCCKLRRCGNPNTICLDWGLSMSRVCGMAIWVVNGFEVRHRFGFFHIPSPNG